MTRITFAGFLCDVVERRYHNGRLAICLEDKGEPVATASVNITNVVMEDDEVAIKDYAENEGMLSELVAAGVVHAPHRHVRSGFVDIPVCRHLFPRGKGCDVRA